MTLEQAKLALYHKLLCLPVDKVTDNEAALGYLLAKDPDIQKRLAVFVKMERRLLTSKEQFHG